MILYSSGLVLAALLSRFVANEVDTLAPFSYVIDAPTAIPQYPSQTGDKRVSAGANRKNFMSFEL